MIDEIKLLLAVHFFLDLVLSFGGGAPVLECLMIDQCDGAAGSGIFGTLVGVVVLLYATLQLCGDPCVEGRICTLDDIDIVHLLEEDLIEDDVDIVIGFESDQIFGGFACAHVVDRHL